MKLKNIIKGILSGTLIISALTFFFKQYAFSRAIILISTAGTIFLILAVRYLHNFFRHGNFRFVEGIPQNVAIAGSPEEYNRVRNIVGSRNYRIVGRIEFRNTSSVHDNHTLGNLNELTELTSIYQFDEIIFCAKDIPPHTIIDRMNLLADQNVSCKIASSEAEYIIGNRSIDSAADLLTVSLNFSIAETKNRIIKRIFDLTAALFLLSFFPLYGIFMRNREKYLGSFLSVLSGNKHIVGYTAPLLSSLPRLKPGIYRTLDRFPENSQARYAEKFVQRIDLLYAKNYSLWTDLEILFTVLFRSGRFRYGYERKNGHPGPEDFFPSEKTNPVRADFH